MRVRDAFEASIEMTAVGSSSVLTASSAERRLTLRFLSDRRSAEAFRDLVRRAGPLLGWLHHFA